MPEVLQPMSPMWWVKKLHARLEEQQREVEFFDAYYRGDHPLPWLAPQAQTEFRRVLLMTRSNYMGLVCDLTAERMQIEGFRLGADAEAADAETWRIWQANGLDSDSDQALLEALICGRAYMLVAPNPTDRATPQVWVEHPSQCVVAYEPGSNRRTRRAGLKVWADEWTGGLSATLWVDGWVYKYAAETKPGVPSMNLDWTERTVAGEAWPARNPLGVVPLIEVPNNPRLLSGGVSEIADVTDIQDRINKTIADRLITQDYGAFPQKWATAWPEADTLGVPTPPIDVGRNRMVTTDVAETRFGQWQAADMDPYSNAKREDVKDIGSRTRVPSQYLLGELTHVNGETLKASESGLISKVRQRMRTAGEPIEDVVRLFRAAAGLPDDGGESMETIWRDPEIRTEGERTDSVVKKLAAGIIDIRLAREDCGYSATTIKRMEDRTDLAAATDPILGAARALMLPAAPTNAPSAPTGG